MKVGFTGSRGELGSQLRLRFEKNNIFTREIDFSGDDGQLTRVLHCAAKLPTAEFEAQVQSNLVFLKKVFDHAATHKIPEFVFFSSQSLYRGLDQEDLSEKTVLADPDFYSLTKRLGEIWLTQTPIPRTLSVRLPGILEIHRSTSLLAKIFDRLTENLPITLGNADRLFNGFLSIGELSVWLQNLELRPGHHLVHLGARRDLSLRDIVQFMKEELGSHSSIEIDVSPKKFVSLDLTQAQEQWGYRPRPSFEVLKEWIFLRNKARSSAVKENAPARP